MRHLTSEQIQEFLDRGLTPMEAGWVQEHLSVCPRCRSEMEAWSLLFSDLGSLPQLDPGPDLARGVLENLQVPEPLGQRVLGWVAPLGPPLPESGHLSAETLQEAVDGTLPRGHTAGARTHLAACDSCRAEMGRWERLFGSLATLGRLAPSAGFAERVMARIRIPAPVPALWAGFGRRAAAWTRSLLPKTRRGWAVAGGIASAPTITVGALFYLVFSHPLVTMGSFTTYVSWKVSALVGSLLSYAASAVLESVALFRAYSIMETLASSPLLLGIGGLTFSLTSALALWVLYRNLVATPSVESRYARARG